MSTEVVAQERRYRREVPRKYKHSLDTRVMWLWNQRFGTVQTVWQHSPDLLDKTAATMLLQAIMGSDLNSIQLVFQRLEGGSLNDDAQVDDSPIVI